MASKMNVKMSRTLDRNTQFAENARKKGKIEIARRCQRVVDEAVQNCEFEVRDLFNNDRVGWRKRNPGSKLAGSFKGKVTANENNTFPVVAEIWSGAHRPGLKSLATGFNYGMREHSITPKNRSLLIFPYDERDRSQGITKRLQVTHPGTTISGVRFLGFMDRAFDMAVRHQLGAAAARSHARRAARTTRGVVR